MADIISIFGLIASITAGVGFIPQVIKTWKTKKTRDISLYMIVLWTTSSISWIIYGLPKNDFYIVGTNLFIFVLTLILLFFKLKYKNR